MKTYTDIEQSKKLAEILPLDTADMWWSKNFLYYNPTACVGISSDYTNVYTYKWGDDDIPCWSLAALLNIIPKHIKQNDGRTYKFHIFNDDGIVIQRWGCSYVAKDYHNRAEYLSDPKLKYPTNIYSGNYEDILDACVEMIVKLKEKKLLQC